MLIEANDISFIYDIKNNSEIYALKDITLSIKPHEFVGIMGPSGCGKSSLIYILSRLRKPTTGVVYYDDRDSDTYSEKELAILRRKKFGFIIQGNFLVEYLSVLENVLIPCSTIDSETMDRASYLLDRLGINHLSSKRPKDISYGQRQLTTIARALVTNPEVIFADEPTSWLDHKNAMDVIVLLREQLSYSSVILATHDGSILEDTDRVIQMWDGQLRKK